MFFAADRFRDRIDRDRRGWLGGEPFGGVGDGLFDGECAGGCVDLFPGCGHRHQRHDCLGLQDAVDDGVDEFDRVAVEVGADLDDQVPAGQHLGPAEPGLGTDNCVGHGGQPPVIEDTTGNRRHGPEGFCEVARNELRDHVRDQPGALGTYRSA